MPSHEFPLGDGSMRSESQVDVLNTKNLGQCQFKGDGVWAAMKTSSGERHSFAQSCVASIFRIRRTDPFSGCLGLTWLSQFPELRYSSCSFQLFCQDQINQVETEYKHSMNTFFNKGRDWIQALHEYILQ